MNSTVDILDCEFLAYLGSDGSQRSLPDSCVVEIKQAFVSGVFWLFVQRPRPKRIVASTQPLSDRALAAMVEYGESMAARSKAGILEMDAVEVSLLDQIERFRRLHRRRSKELGSKATITTLIYSYASYSLACYGPRPNPVQDMFVSHAWWFGAQSLANGSIPDKDDLEDAVRAIVSRHNKVLNQRWKSRDRAALSTPPATIREGTNGQA